jgi:hypothetical protein
VVLSCRCGQVLAGTPETVTDGSGGPGPARSGVTPGQRVRTLEARVAALTEALQVLARGLEEPPTAEPGGRPAAKAARTAREMLLSAGSGQAATPRD